MVQKMLKFISVEREMPEKRAEGERADDFGEVYRKYAARKADFRTHATSIPGIYAAGDIVRGASLVVWAIRDGREAADAIAERLNGMARVAAE